MEQSKADRKPVLRALCEAIKARIDYRQFYLRFCREERPTISGARLQTRCPIPAHAHTGKGQPSFSVDLARGLFHCFSRDEGGDAIRFYELMHNVSFARAVYDMARELNLDPETHDSRQTSLAFASAPDAETADYFEPINAPLAAERMSCVCERFLEVCREEDQTEAVNYLARRGIDRETVRGAGISYFPRRAYRRVMRCMQESFALAELQQSGLFNARAHLTFYRHRLLFPFYVERRAVYLQARTTAAGVEPRWHNLRGGVPALYNIDALDNLASDAIVYLVEGFTDTLTLAAHNFAAVGLVGAGGLKEEWIASLARFQVVAALDPDTAGERAAVRYREMFARRGLQLACLKLSSDINEFFRHRPSAALELALLTETALDEFETNIAANDASGYN
ncbi:MAG: CHC2 zinc finger domain-containing protein [Pyrinomonadaceae bacterium]